MSLPIKLQKICEDQVVSSLNLYILENDDPTHEYRPFALIEHMWTLPGFENKSYATKLLMDAIKRAKEANCYKICLMTSSRKPNVHHLYEKVGFLSGHKKAYWMDLDQ